ncbi:hypothetical protein CEQ36_21590 [Yersinia intermedia]|nr:hypothetical protein A6J67_08815 [Yersinia sp. FDAARGOS_228]AVL37901.1 hypothetical protein CEQ36_21590 [Yersinia intermedia]
MVLYVQFSDETETTIITWFASPQSSSNFNFLGEVEPSDGRWVAFYDATPAFAINSIPKP